MTQTDKTNNHNIVEPSPNLVQNRASDPTQNTSFDPVEHQIKRRPWPVTVLGLLLLFQSIGLWSLGLYRLVELNLDWNLTFSVLILQLLSTLLTSSIFIPLSLLALWAAIGFLYLWRSAWLNAMLVQGLSLFVALLIYFYHNLAFAYIMMVYSIFMVIYLHAPDVQLAFRADSSFNNQRQS